MEDQKVELINNILKIVYNFGWEVGASHDPDHYVDLVDVNGYLKDDINIDKNIRENLAKLLENLGYDSQEFNIYTKEDTGPRSFDWDYIAPLIERKENRHD